MNLRDFLKTWEGVRQENRLYRFLVIGLILANVFTSMAAMRVERSVILVPPQLNGEAEVLRNRASRNFIESWGLYVAELIGNVSPANVEFVKDALAPMLASEIYRDVMDDLVAQIEEIKREGVSISFHPREILYEVETNKVFVTGTTRIEAPGSKPVTKQRTYEMIIDINNYRPIIRHIDAYGDRPRTLEVLRNAKQS